MVIVVSGGVTRRPLEILAQGKPMGEFGCEEISLCLENNSKRYQTIFKLKQLEVNPYPSCTRETKRRVCLFVHFVCVLLLCD